MDILLLKCSDEEKALAAAEQYKKWLEKKSKGDDEVDIEEAMVVDQELDEKMNVWRSFASFENQAEMQRAVGYSDRWFKDGERSFNVYYVCMAGGVGYECFTEGCQDRQVRQ